MAAPNQWTGGTHADICVLTETNSANPIQRVFREGEVVGNLNNSGGNGGMNPLPNTNNGNETTTTVNPSGGVDNGGSGLEREWSSVSPRFISAYTGQPLSIAQYQLSYTCGQSGTSLSGTTSVMAPGGEVCSFQVNIPNSGANGYPGRMLTVAGPIADLNVPRGGAAAQVQVSVADSYQAHVVYTSPFATSGLNLSTPIDVQASNGQRDSFRVTHNLARDYYWPPGYYTLHITGQNTLTEDIGINLSSQPVHQHIPLRRRFGLNVYISSWGERMGGNVLAIINNFHHWIHDAAIRQMEIARFQHMFNMAGNLFAVNHHSQSDAARISRDSAATTHVLAGSFDHATGRIHHNMAGVYNNSAHLVGANGQRFYVTADGTIYQEEEYWVTPIKLHLSPGNAELNNDDSFVLDTDGFTLANTPELKTRGGLNANEAWLILDRQQNGTWTNNKLDNDDLFGDHMGSLPNGYVDLQKTFAHEIKTDKDGRHYIALTGHSLWGEWQLAFSRAFMGDTVPYAAYDLKLLTRDRTLIPARDVVQKIYVDYRNVQEFTPDHANAIFQRGWVQYNSGEFSESADMYFAASRGMRRKLSEDEAQKVRQQLSLPKPGTIKQSLAPKVPKLSDKLTPDFKLENPSIRIQQAL